jgi:AcrR family transcriptional regulator
MPKGIPLTEKEQQLRRREIITACAPLFLENGFHETSMREVAEAAGLGKSTLYDYFRSKEEILLFYFEDALGGITQRAREIIAQEANVSEKLRRIMLMHLGYLVENQKIFLILSFEAQRLSAAGQEQLQAQRHAYQDMLRELIEEGQCLGEFRQVNSLFAARSVFSLLSLAVFTSRPTGTPEQMLEEAMAIFFTGIQA